MQLLSQFLCCVPSLSKCLCIHVCRFSIATQPGNGMCMVSCMYTVLYSHVLSIHMPPCIILPALITTQYSTHYKCNILYQTPHKGPRAYSYPTECSPHNLSCSHHICIVLSPCIHPSYKIIVHMTSLHFALTLAFNLRTFTTSANF